MVFTACMQQYLPCRSTIFLAWMYTKYILNTTQLLLQKNESIALGPVSLCLSIAISRCVPCSAFSLWHFSRPAWTEVRTGVQEKMLTRSFMETYKIKILQPFWNWKTIWLEKTWLPEVVPRQKMTCRYPMGHPMTFTLGWVMFREVLWTTYTFLWMIDK